MKRKYDIGGGVIITDDGYSLLAEHKSGDRTTCSIGIKRPYIGPLPDSLKAMYSLDGRYFYLSDFVGMDGFWLGVETWADLDAMKAQMGSGLFGKGYATFTDNGKQYHREVLHFVSWNVKAEREHKTIAKIDPAAQDYLALAQNDLREQEKRFNEVIAPSGRTLKWIVDRIGAWVPLPPEPPPVVLAD